MRFAKVPEAALDLPDDLIGKYARLAMVADFETGWLSVDSLAEAAVIMGGSERTARRALDALRAKGLITAGFPIALLDGDKCAAKCAAKSVITPSLQKVTEKKQRTKPSETFWLDFVEGRTGDRPPKGLPYPSGFATAVRACDAPPEHLRRICRAAGESYADWNGAVNWGNVIDRGAERLSVSDGETKSFKEAFDAW